MNQPKNILFLITDQQTREALSCRGWPGVLTPNLDRLVAEGLWFTHSVCPSPVCGPARASIATGHYPTRHGLIYNHDERFVDDEAARLPTFADGLRSAGMEPYWIGKWHASEFYPEEEKPVHGFHYLPIEGDGNKAYGAEVDGAAVDRAVAFLQDPPDERFFLGVSLHNPHDICMWIGEQGDPKLEGIQEGGELPPLPDNHEISNHEPGFWTLARQRRFYGAEMQSTPPWGESEWREYLRTYNRLVEHVDRNLGRVLDALDDAGLGEDTLVVFTSDHGEGCAAHKMVVKLTLYEEVAGVPLICRWPGRVEPGSVCGSHVASGLDLAPTFLEAAGAEAMPGIPGQSLLPQMLDPKVPGRDSSVVQLHPDPERPELEARLLRTPDFAYMVFSHGEPREALYDMRTDPGQTRNMIQEESFSGELTRLRAKLAEWLSRAEDPFPLPVQKNRG